MATISIPHLDIVAIPNNITQVTAKVTYTLTPTSVEKLAGSVFSESIQLIGDDPGVISDIVIATFPVVAFAVNSGTTTVTRTRTRTVNKSAMNEDAGYETTGAEQSDEAFARITLAYAANPPIPPTLPPATATNTVTGCWK